MQEGEGLRAWLWASLQTVTESGQGKMRIEVLRGILCFQVFIRHEQIVQSTRTYSLEKRRKFWRLQCGQSFNGPIPPDHITFFERVVPHAVENSATLRCTIRVRDRKVERFASLLFPFPSVWRGGT